MKTLRPVLTHRSIYNSHPVELGMQGIWKSSTFGYVNMNIKCSIVLNFLLSQKNHCYKHVKPQQKGPV